MVALTRLLVVAAIAVAACPALGQVTEDFKSKCVERARAKSPDMALETIEKNCDGAAKLVLLLQQLLKGGSVLGGTTPRQVTDEQVMAWCQQRIGAGERIQSALEVRDYCQRNMEAMRIAMGAGPRPAPGATQPNAKSILEALLSGRAQIAIGRQPPIATQPSVPTEDDLKALLDMFGSKPPGTQ